MKIHEFQAKELLRNAGIPVPSGRLAHSPAQAADGAKDLPGPPWKRRWGQGGEQPRASHERD
jgi:succinyl-CoA synthetase beta subunit